MDPILGVGVLPAPNPLFRSGLVNPISTLLAGTTASSSLFAGGSVVVQLSQLGQSLSAVASFQDAMQALASPTPGFGQGQNFATDVESLAAEAQFLVTNFNGLQANLTGLGISDPAVARFSLALTSQAQALLENGDSELGSLDQIGIDLIPSSVPGLGGRLEIDMERLRAALTVDPAGAFALLDRAGVAFGGLAAGYASEATPNLVLASLAGQLTMAGSGLLGVGDLLALGALGQSGTSSQVLLALNQFNLISSLLG